MLALQRRFPILLMRLGIKYLPYSIFKEPKASRRDHHAIPSLIILPYGVGCNTEDFSEFVWGQGTPEFFRQNHDPYLCQVEEALVVRNLEKINDSRNHSKKCKQRHLASNNHTARRKNRDFMKTPTRLTTRQKKLVQGVKGLLDIYNRCAGLDVETEQGKSILLKRLHAFLLKYFVESRVIDGVLVIRPIFPEKILSENQESHYAYALHIDDEDFCAFIEAMHLMKECLGKYQYAHFFLLRLEEVSIREISEPEVYAKLEGDLHYKEKEKADFEKLLANRDISFQVGGIKNVKLDDVNKSNLYTNNYFKLYTVSVSDTLGEKIVALPPIEHEIGTVKDILMQKWLSFTDLARSILVVYHLEFGSFSRIKICKCCENLYHEDKEGKKQYCSDRCRKRYNHVDEEVINKCYFKQRQWLDRLIERAGLHKLTHVSRSICNDCLQIRQGNVKGGECKPLKILNRDFFVKDLGSGARKWTKGKKNETETTAADLPFSITAK